MEDSEAALQQTGGGAPPIKRPSIEGVESALLDNDLSELSPQQRVQYMDKVCESVGLNPLTKPFRYIRLNGQLTLYATRDAAEQLRKVHGISITSLEESWREDLCIFRAYAEDADGRTDVATGAVDTSRSSGQSLANDIMKAETKAKRRVTLSLAGLGWLDETEVQDIPENATEEVQVDHETGEVVNAKADTWYQDAIDWLAGRDATWPEIIDHADRVPSKEHPLKDWPDEWWDEAKAAVTSGKATNGSASTTTSTDQATTKAAATKASLGPQEDEEYEDADAALAANFDEAWQSDNRNWDSISEAQAKRMYAIAQDNEWSDAALNRLIKDELGYESKGDVPYGDPYDEICAALEDERLRYHMSRDPDTPDMFEEQGDTEANDEAFEDGTDSGDLPF